MRFLHTAFNGLAVVLVVVCAQVSSSSTSVAGQVRYGTSHIHALLNGRPKSSPNASLVLQIGIPPRNVQRLHAEWLARSTPGSPNFQQWMQRDEVRQLAANPVATTAVLKFLSNNGVTAPTSSSPFFLGSAPPPSATTDDDRVVQVSFDGLWITVVVSVQRASTCLLYTSPSPRDRG